MIFLSNLKQILNKGILHVDKATFLTTNVNKTIQSKSDKRNFKLNN